MDSFDVGIRVWWIGGKYKVVQDAVIAAGVLPNSPFEYDPFANATLDSLSLGCGLR